MHQLMDLFRLGGRLSAADEMSKFILKEQTLVVTKGTQSGNDFRLDQLNSFQNRAIVLPGVEAMRLAPKQQHCTQKQFE